LRRPRELLVTTRQQFDKLLAALAFTEDVIVDTETSGLETWQGDLLAGIGLSLDDGSTFYCAFRHQPVRAEHTLFWELDDEYSYGPDNLPLDWLPELLEAIARVPTLVGQNLKFDLGVLHQDGFVSPEGQRLEETITAARLNATGQHPKLDLETLVKKVFGKQEAGWKGDFRKIVPKIKVPGKFDAKGKPVVKMRFDMVSAVKTAEYCESDCLHTRRIRDHFVVKIKESKQTRVWEQECELLRVLWDMERVGMYTDQQYAAEMIPKMEEKQAHMAEVIFDIVGYRFQIGSKDELTKALTSLGIASPHKTPTGKPKWGLAEVIAIKEPEGLGQAILNWRALDKVLTTYFRPALAKGVGGIVHTSFKPWGTDTGRMSCENPNLQNISKALQKLSGNDQDEETLKALEAMIGARQGSTVEMVTVTGRKVGGHTLAGVMSMADEYEDDGDTVSVRRLYVPRPGFHLYMYDYSQMEMRVFADYVGDPKLTALLEDPKGDFHDTVTMAVWGIEKTHNLWGFYRNLAKTVNFGLVYGLGIDKLAIQIQKTPEEAEEFKKEYFARFPAAEEFIKSVSRTIKERGTPLGTFHKFTSKKTGKEYTIENRSPGWISNRFGRKYILEQERSYVGVNYLVQGSSADIVKNRMIGVSKFLKQENLRSRLLVQVHDEVALEIHEDEERWLAPKVLEIMEERQIKTLLPVEASKGFPSWAHKHKVCLSCFGPKKKAKKGELEKPHVCLPMAA
jgi:DNA polymerase-1